MSGQSNEAVGISETLANRLSKLEQQRAETESALQEVPAPVTFLPDVVPPLVQRWRELVLSIESLALNHMPRGRILTKLGPICGRCWAL